LDPPYDIKLVFVQKNTFLLRKINKKLLPPELHFLSPICTKSFLGWGFASDPLGELAALPLTPYLYLLGLLLKGGKGRGRGERRRI